MVHHGVDVARAARHRARRGGARRRRGVHLAQEHPGPGHRRARVHGLVRAVPGGRVPAAAVVAAVAHADGAAARVGRVRGDTAAGGDVARRRGVPAAGRDRAALVPRVPLSGAVRRLCKTPVFAG
ncbi:Basic proline-rich protein (fragment) [Bacillus mycoides]|uniref:Basic proline-rich protein n=1 Tax=Bacillus mycoides TaxID=1405 RepID=A0A653VZK2_BACMY